MIKFLFLLITQNAHAEPGVCQPLPACDTTVTPDERVTIACSPYDVERCLALERKDCSYFVKLHGEVVAGGEYGYVSRPQIQVDETISGWTVIGNVHGALEVVTSNVTSPEVYPFGEFRHVSGERIHVSPDKSHFAFVAMRGKHLALNTDGVWHKLPAHEALYNLRFTDYRVLVDYQTYDAELLTFVANLPPVTTVTTR
jgi:hypothetical protein